MNDYERIAGVIRYLDERYAQHALGHGSKAIHRTYAKNAHVILPSMEAFEEAVKNKIVPLAAVA
jgi:hypothetical protein